MSQFSSTDEFGLDNGRSKIIGKKNGENGAINGEQGSSSMADRVASLETILRESTFDESVKDEFNRDCILRESILLNVDFNYTLLHNLLIIAGVRTIGKSTIIKELKRDNRISPIVTDTTRQPRPEELLFRELHEFVDLNLFNSKLKNGDYAFAYKMNNYYYGVPKVQLTKNGPLSFPVLGVVSPQAFYYLITRKVFPNAVTALIHAMNIGNNKIEQDDLIFLDSRIERCMSERGIKDKKDQINFQQKVANDYSMFSNMLDLADMVFFNKENNLQIIDEKWLPYLTHNVKSNIRDISDKIMHYMSLHMIHYLKNPGTREKVPNTAIFGDYFRQILNYLYNENIPSIKRPEIVVSLNRMIHKEDILRYLQDKELKGHELFYKNAIKRNALLYRAVEHPNTLRVDYPFFGESLPFEHKQLQLLGFIIYALESNRDISLPYRFSRDGYGLNFSLTDYNFMHEHKLMALEINFNSEISNNFVKEVLKNGARVKKNE